MRDRLSEVIDGWFAVAYSRDIAAGALRVVDYMGRAIALFRTQSGRLLASDAYCPHLGAALATMGRVEGEELVCGGHGFHFDDRGVCTRAYGRAASNVRLRTCHVREQLGAIFLWYHHRDAAPSWELPALDEAAWSAPLHKSLQLATHPQEIVENAVDVGHFEGVHGLSQATSGKLQVAGHRLSSSGTFTSRAIGPFDQLCVTVSFQFEAFGLGLARSEAYFPGLGLRLRAYAAPTLRKDGTTELRCWTQVYDAPGVVSRLPGVGRAIPAALARFLLGRAWGAVFSHDLAKDALYWTTKRYLSPPALARLDTQIGPYRKWALQFYPAHTARRTRSLPTVTVPGARAGHEACPLVPSLDGAHFVAAGEPARVRASRRRREPAAISS